MKRTIPSELYPQELGWLVGIIEGEGSISNYVSNYMATRTTKKRGTFQTPRSVKIIGVSIINTDKLLLERVLEIFNKIQVHAHIKQKAATVANLSGRSDKYPIKSTRMCYEIVVRRQLDVLKILEVIIPHMCSEKKAKAERLYRETLQAVKKGSNSRRVTTKRRAPQTLETFADDAIVWSY